MHGSALQGVGFVGVSHWPCPLRQSRKSHNYSHHHSHGRHNRHNRHGHPATPTKTTMENEHRQRL